MKKSKLSIGLVTSFIGALALTACDNSTPAVTKSKNSIVNFIGYNGSTDKIEINVDELYSEYSNSKEGTTLYYNAILEALTRYEYPLISAQDAELKSYARIESEANDKVKAMQQTAKDNAKNNGTDYDKEWDKILDNNDVDSTKDLKLKFIYELEKEALADWYYKAHSETKDGVSGLREQYLGVNSDWKAVTGKTENVDSVYPYHILHILVKLSADKSDYTRGTITEAEATKLWQVVRMLLDSKFTWAEVAKLSDDTSKDDFGDVGIMSTNTSFYNEFKLGIYAYDAILSQNNSYGTTEETSTDNHIYDAFGLGKDLNGQPASIVTETLADGEHTQKVVDLVKSEMNTNVNTHLNVENTNLPTIPFDVFRLIGEHAKDEKFGNETIEGSEVSLPRNVLFNAFLNFHSPFVITNELIKQSSITETNDYADVIGEYQFNDASILKFQNGLQDTNFLVDKLGGLFDKNVLCDADGNVVIGVRSEAGIHFMVMRKSVFYNTNVLVQKDSTSLADYYTTYVPTDEEYPEGKDTYVNMKKSDDVSYYTNRANTIKSDIKSTDTFDAAYDYRIYEALLDFKVDGTAIKDKLHFSDEDEQGNSVVRNNIIRNIELLRETHHENRYSSLNNAWQSYLLMLMAQNEWRSDENQFEGAFVPTTCAFSFSKENKDLWEEGGLCYVKK